MNGPSDASPRWFIVPVVGIVILAAASYGFVPERACNDVWWHLKTGKVIVEAGGRLPEYDVFTYPAEVEKIPWHNHEWLAQVLFYQMFEWGGGVVGHLRGLRALIGFKALILVATFLLVLLLVQRRCRCLPAAALITLLALDVSRRTLYPRPPVFTYLFLALFLYIRDNWKSGRWPKATLLTLPPLTAVWANLHGGFLVGLIVVFLYGLAEAAEYFFRRGGRIETGTRPCATSEPGCGPTDRAQEFRSRVAWLGGTWVACVVASLCTPYHYHLYELPFRVMKHAALVNSIPEMGSPLAPHVAKYYLSFFVMAALLVVGSAGVRLVRGERLPTVDLLLLLFFGCEAARHIRHLPLFAIAMAPLLGWAAGRMLTTLGEVRRRDIAWLGMAATLLLAVYWIAVREGPQSYWNRNLRLAAGVTYVQDNFPTDVCDFILANGFERRMFNPINVAGYMIWRLSPEHHKLFTDSRFDVFGDRFVWHEMVVREGLERADWEQDRVDLGAIGLNESDSRHVRERVGSAGWSEILDEWDVNFIVAERSWRLLRDQKLRLSSDWERVFHWLKPPFNDPYDGYEIYVRKTPANGELIRRCRRSFAELQKIDRRYGREPL